MIKVATVILVLCVASNVAAKPYVTAHISKQDIRKIAVAIRAVTRNPIEAIDAIQTTTPGLKVRPVGRSILYFAGTQREVANYERTDQVLVIVESGPHIGGSSFVMRKTGAKWKIQSKGSWMR